MSARRRTVKPELLISVDVETDGPIPGPFSMVSIGACAVGVRTEAGLTRFDVDDPENGFYAELRPISERWDPEALAVSGLEREALIADGQDPKVAMTAFADWVEQLSARHSARPIFAAYPLSFDWMFVYWYLVDLEVKSPFGFSGCLDMKTMYATKADVLIGRGTKRWMPAHLLGQRAHTHNALDDARGQGDLLANLIEWHGPEEDDAPRPGPPRR